MAPPRRLLPSAGGGALLAGVTALFAVGSGGIREDEFQCELAVAHLDACCEDFDPRAIRCTFDAGCGNTDFTALAPEESECVQSLECDELRTADVCGRVAARTPRTTVTSEDGGVVDATPRLVPVCP